MKIIVGIINTHEKSCAGFGSITQVIALPRLCGALMTHARRHAVMSPELPEGFKSGVVYAGRPTGTIHVNRL